LGDWGYAGVVAGAKHSMRASCKHRQRVENGRLWRNYSPVAGYGSVLLTVQNVNAPPRAVAPPDIAIPCCSTVCLVPSIHLPKCMCTRWRSSRLARSWIGEECPPQQHMGRSADSSPRHGASGNSISRRHLRPCPGRLQQPAPGSTNCVIAPGSLLRYPARATVAQRRRIRLFATSSSASLRQLTS
jgi:hypothetical protein